MSTGWSHDSKEPVVENKVDQLARGPALAHRAASPPGSDRSHRARTTPCWSRVGGAAWSLAGHLGPVGVEEAQRRAGQGQAARAPSARRRPAVPGWRSGPTRRPRRSSAPCRRGCRPQPAARGAARPPSRRRPARPPRWCARGWPTRSELVARPRSGGSTPKPSQNVATVPRCPPRSARHRRGSGTGRRARSTGGGCPAPDRPRRQRSSGCPGRRARRRSAASSEVRTTVPTPVRSPLVQGGEDAVRAVHPASRSAIGTPDALRVLGTGAGQRHQSGLALGDLVVARAAALGSVVTEAGHREHDQPRVALAQRRRSRARAARARRCGSSRPARRRGRRAAAARRGRPRP